MKGEKEGIREYARYGWYYEVHELGFKYHMNDIAAAIGLVQLAKLDASNRRRREIAEQYTRSFANADWLTYPIEQPATKSCWHNYVVRTKFRDQLILFLKDQNIATGVHYLPLHLQPYFRHQRQTSLPQSEQVWKDLLSLPIYPDLHDEQLTHIVESLSEFRRQSSQSESIVQV